MSETRPKPDPALERFTAKPGEIEMLEDIGEPETIVKYHYRKPAEKEAE